MSTIRINQRLREGYNPDGTPGTVSTGVEGAPGRPPTAEEIGAAVAAYIASNPVVVQAVTTKASEFNRFGAGADGSPGAYVDLGSHNTLHGYVSAAGTPAVVNLYLTAKGQIVSSTDHVFLASIQAQGGITVRGANGVEYDLSTRLTAIEATSTGTPADFVAAFTAALS